jgi:hypothetical protein
MVARVSGGGEHISLASPTSQPLRTRPSAHYILHTTRALPPPTSAAPALITGSHSAMGRLSSALAATRLAADLAPAAGCLAALRCSMASSACPAEGWTMAPVGGMPAVGGKGLALAGLQSCRATAAGCLDGGTDLQRCEQPLPSRGFCRSCRGGRLQPSAPGHPASSQRAGRPRPAPGRAVPRRAAGAHRPGHTSAAPAQTLS